eukprot:6174562-Pleurochrysis_carterae.AAC.7
MLGLRCGQATVLTHYEQLQPLDDLDAAAELAVRQVASKAMPDGKDGRRSWRRRNVQMEQRTTNDGR